MFPSSVSAMNRHRLLRCCTAAIPKHTTARHIKTITFDRTTSTIYEPSDYPTSTLPSLFSTTPIAVLGYGPQGRAQSLNLRDASLPVHLGLRKDGRSWPIAVNDGWIPGKDLFDIPEACDRGAFIVNVLSDAGQKNAWKDMRDALTPGKILCFAHGFSVVYAQHTGVVPPKEIDVVMVAPKGTGYMLRSAYLSKQGMNASYAIHQNPQGEKAVELTRGYAFAIGTRYLFPTTFQHEATADLVSERGSLLAGIHGLFLAQYETLRARGHAPIEAYNETVEEATQALYPLIGAHGMDWVYRNISATAQRGNLDWYKKFRDAILPVMDEVYEKVVSGEEARRCLEMCSKEGYREATETELKHVDMSEIWQVGRVVRSLRPVKEDDADTESEQD